MDIPGGGVFGRRSSSETPPAEASAALHDEEANLPSATSDTSGVTTADADAEALPPSPLPFELLYKDDSNLAEAWPVLDRRCQEAVADRLQRLADNDRLPKVYPDLLDGLRFAPLDGTDDVRVVYFIGVGARPTAHLVVSRLLHALYSPKHIFLLHLDVKAAAEAADAVLALAAKHANVHVMSARRLVQWGMYTMIATAQDALESLLRASTWLHFDFFINLSDADLALRTNAEMVEFLKPMRGRSMINVHGTVRRTPSTPRASAQAHAWLRAARDHAHHTRRYWSCARRCVCHSHAAVSARITPLCRSGTRVRSLRTPLSAAKAST